MEEIEEQEVDLKKLFKIIGRTKWLFVVLVIFNTVLLALYMLFIVTPQYATSTKVLIDSGDTSISDFLPDRDVIGQVSENLNIDNTTVLSDVKASFDPTKKVITIVVTADSQDDASRVLETYRDLLKPALKEIYNINKFDIIVNPDTPQSTYPSKIKKGLLIDAAVSILIYALYIMYLVSKTQEKVSAVIKKSSVNILGKIEEENAVYRKELWITDNRNQIENFNRIMVNTELNRKLLRPKTLLITDLNSNNEACYVAINLAIAYVNLRKKVLIINTVPSLKIPGDIFSTVEIAAGSIEMMMADGMEIDNIDVMSKEAENMIDTLVKNNDVIIIIGETILNKADAIAWAHITDATVLTVKESKFEEENLVKAKEYIEKVDGKLSGVVIAEDEADAKTNNTKKNKSKKKSK